LLAVAAGGLIFLIVAISLAAVRLAGSWNPVVITWSSASELDTAGYNLLRGTSPRGPFVRINPQPIPPSGDSLLGGDYTYEDRDGTSGIASYYLLQSLSRGGEIRDLQVIEVEGESTPAKSLWLAVMVVGLALLAVLRRLQRRVDLKASG